MNVSHFPGGIAVLKRHEWVCLFLAFSLLYNPFLAAPRTMGGLEVGHPASHRATVGASELQHFTPANGWGCLPAADIAVAEVVESSLEFSTESFFVLHLSLPAHQFSGPGLWFRPPPVF
jgi:hypothetical protein